MLLGKTQSGKKISDEKNSIQMGQTDLRITGTICAKKKRVLSIFSKVADHR